ncbi:MAG: hypothetical protein ACRDTC_16980 [Pseudonocardiaceae bacterium]
MSTAIKSIRAKGHWDIAIRPEPFRSDLVLYDQLDVIVNQAVVRLRGWPMPFIDYREPFLRGQNWIGQDIEAHTTSHREAWRFFTSGQFTQLRVISADRRGAEEMPLPGGASSVIEVWEILFYLTEVIELAARLAMSDAGGDQMTIDARLHGLKNRLLVSEEPVPELHKDYRSSMPCIQEKRTPQRENLVSEPQQIAVDMAREIFLHFGFKASKIVLADYQRELTESL